MKTTRIAGLSYSNLRQAGRAVLIGLAAGLVVSLFRWAIQNLLGVVIKAFAYFHGHPVWLLPWTGMSIFIALLLGNLVQKNPDIKGSGIPQVEGQLTGQFDEEWWPVLWRKFFGGIISIGSGLFLGREGPSIQLGAVREFLGTGKIFDLTIMPEEYGMLVFVLAPGAFIALGYLIALINSFKKA